MKEFKTDLLREKFVILDPGASNADGRNAIVALSNRVLLDLRDDKGKLLETIVVRGHNMHSVVRMAARIVQSFNNGGPLLDRQAPYDWDAAWEAVAGEYEQNFNPLRWIAIYSRGRSVFAKGEHHPFLDVIEKCADGNKGGYDSSIGLAENFIKKTGKVVKIEYDGNMALVVDIEKTQARFAIILRSPNRTTKFNYSATARPNNEINIPQCLSVAAAFLEGIQLAFMVGMNGEKIKRGIIARHSDEEKLTKEGGRRLSRLNAEIANLEAAATVHYRPERPEFQSILMDAERLAQQILTPAKKR